MTESTKVKTLFDLRTISIYFVIALIVGAGAGYMVGNSPLSNLIEQKDWLEETYDSLYLSLQSIASDLDSALDLLAEEQIDNALLQEQNLEMLAIDQENQVLEQYVTDLELAILKLEYSYIDLITSSYVDQFGAISYQYWPDTHTAQFYKEIYDSLELTWEIEPPPGEQHIDITDIFKLTVTVKNNYEVLPFQTGEIQMSLVGYPIIPSVLFKEVHIHVSGTGFVEVQNPEQDNTWVLVTGEERLVRGATVTKDIYLKALESSDRIVTVAGITVHAELDLEAFFKFDDSTAARAKIRPPPEP